MTDERPQNPERRSLFEDVAKWLGRSLGEFVRESRRARRVIEETVEEVGDEARDAAEELADSMQRVLYAPTAVELDALEARKVALEAQIAELESRAEQLGEQVAAREEELLTLAESVRQTEADAAGEAAPADPPAALLDEIRSLLAQLAEAQQASEDAEETLAQEDSERARDLRERFRRLAERIRTVILSVLAWTIFQSRDAIFEIILSEELYGPGKERLLPWVQEQWRRYAGRVDAAEVAPASPLPTPTVESPLPTPEPSPAPRPRITAPYPEWTPVPAGWFWMGSDSRQDGLAFSNEQPQHRARLGAYRIGKYPVTNAQFRAFVESTKYKTTAEVEGTAWVYHNREWVSVTGASWNRPLGPESDIVECEDHPVVQVSWHDAVAYCEWLSRQLGRPVRLPSEAEWEKAARGTDGRVYPWGNQPPNDRLCNFNRNVGGTTAVGRYPAGRSPYGCYDMAGNVWEWTSSLWGSDRQKPEFSYPYDANDGREDMRAGNDVRRVVRGGSWYDRDHNVRCAVRCRDYPNSRRDLFGFRVMSPGL